MKKIRIFILSTIMLLGMQAGSFAQCAMCRATIENNVSNGDTTVGAGLNMGILYLFAAPYLLISVIAILWYRQAKMKRKFAA